MPLRDHFHPPLKQLRHWESFHSRWINSIADALNEAMPEGYFAEPEVHAGATIEVDVGSFQSIEQGAVSNGPPAINSSDSGGTALAVLPMVYTPPLADLSVDTALADDFEVRIFREIGGLKLVGAIELVSPGNKDRPDATMAFATKCASYLHNSVALMVIDVVTSRSINLHDEIMPLITQFDAPEIGDGALYAVAYQPIRRKDKDQIDIWPRRLAVGEPLPTLPLWLNAVLSVPVHLETTYALALRRARIE
jgi:hypothetical protein